MAKNKNDYFELMHTQVECCVEAAQLLESILSEYEKHNPAEERIRMHEIEHRADEIHHDILRRLTGEFITPIDQEDILRLVQIIDDVTDALDEVMLEMYMFHIDTLPAGAAGFAAIVSRCVSALAEAVGELKSFKRPDQLRKLIVNVNTIEGEADEVFTEAIYTLFSGSADIRAVFGGKAIYESLENCCDLCEHAADVIDQIIIKNT